MTKESLEAIRKHAQSVIEITSSWDEEKVSQEKLDTLELMQFDISRMTEIVDNEYNRIVSDEGFDE